MNPQDKALAEVYRLILAIAPVTSEDQIKEPAAVTAGPIENENPTEDYHTQSNFSTNEVTNE